MCYVLIWPFSQTLQISGWYFRILLWRTTMLIWWRLFRWTMHSQVIFLTASFDLAVLKFGFFFSEIVCARQKKKIFTTIAWKTVIARRTIYVTFISIVKSKYILTYIEISLYLWFQLFSKCVKDESTSIPTSTLKVYKLRGELFSRNIILDLSWFFGRLDSLEFMNFLHRLH